MTGRATTLEQKRSFQPQFGPQVFFGVFSSTRCYTLSQAEILCNIKENWWCKFEKMEKILISDPIWRLQFFFREFYFCQLGIVPSNFPIQFKGKLMNQTWENGKKPYFRPNFGPFGTNLGPQNVFRGFYLY